ncbi:MAG: hypothetical protein GC193_05325 [Cryomorphaceae bacterium]|nr:hypothetical protein [Cryomorphaceae bacterium]
METIALTVRKNSEFKKLQQLLQSWKIFLTCEEIEEMDGGRHRVTIPDLNKWQIRHLRNRF